MVTAALVVGADGSSVLNNSSTALSTPEDHKEFLARRRQSDCIIIGGKTAQRESYGKTPCPLVIVSHQHPALLEVNPQSHWWNMSPASAVDKAEEIFGQRVTVEGGADFLTLLLAAGKIDQLNLTVTPRVGGEKKVVIPELLAYFSQVEIKDLGGETILYECTQPITPN
ncbi:MAG: dihydrofolate reductase family protein [Actinomycetota bacterium]